MTRRCWPVLAAVLAAVLVLGACTHGNSHDYEYKGAQKVGTLIPVSQRKPAEDVTASTLDGKQFNLASDKGKVVLLNFWATWCSPCVVETPQLDSVYRTLKSKGVVFVGVDSKDLSSKAKSFVEDNKITYPIVSDETGRIPLKLGNIDQQGLPITVLIDRQGRVAAVYITPLTPKDITPVLNELRAAKA